HPCLLQARPRGLVADLPSATARAVVLHASLLQGPHRPRRLIEMPSALPIADPASLDGSLPASVTKGADARNFGVYLHVPFCRVRCGYCDFNTYTSEELRGAKRSDYAGQAMQEVALAGRVMREAGLPERPVSTVFFGGGTPTLLPASDLASMLASVSDTWEVATDPEITTEANPDSVDLDYLLAL